VVLGASGAEAVVTNHAVPGPLISRRALSGTGSLTRASSTAAPCSTWPAGAEVHGARARGLEGAQKIVALSSHSAGTVAEDFPDLAGKTLSFPGGVDTELFRPDALDRGVTAYLNGGPGRGPQQRAALREALDRGGDAGDLADSLREIAASYDARSHDADAGDRLEAFLDRGGPLVVYVGKLIHSKGVHSLVSAFARVRRETGARLLVIGFGTFREGLEALVHSLSAGDETTVERLAELGKILEGGPAAPLEHFELSEELLRDAVGLEDDVLFTGPVYHEELAKICRRPTRQPSLPSSPRPSGSWRPSSPPQASSRSSRTTPVSGRPGR
jgi:glycosyltransferase involved in cell wall biosynthesis